jgi:hypothetical protein
MRRTLALAAAALLASCGFPAEEKPVVAAERLPQAVCDRAKAAVAELTDKGALVLNTPTDGVMSQEAWVPVPANAKEAMMNAIGLAATCAGEPQLEQEVTIHSEFGDLMMRRIVKTSFSAGDALAE